MIAVTKGLGLTHLLLGLCGVLILVDGVEWAFLNNRINQSRGIVKQPVESGVSLDWIGGHEFLLPPKQSFSEFVERPLMVQGRRPVSEPGAEPVVAGPVIRGEMQIKLMGIVMTPDGITALMQDGTGAYHRLQIDGMIDGWELAEMYSDRVVLKQGGSREEVRLRKPKPKEPLPVSRTQPQSKPTVPKKTGQPSAVVPNLVRPPLQKPGIPTQSAPQ